jgi:spermidine synthase
LRSKAFEAKNTSRLKVQQYVFERTGRATLTAYGVSKRLFSGKTRFQQIELWENPDHGKLLLLDGELQSASNDEFIYHETLVQPALARCQEPTRGLILGGGEGGTLRELLRPNSMESVTMVDIDGEVVELCRRVIPEQSNGAFEDPRTKLIIGDALGYLRKTNLRFDLIVSDLTEPKNQELSTSLFSKESFALIRSRLRQGGVFTLQASQGSLGKTDTHLRIVRALKSVFPNVQTLLVHMPSFCCHWCFALASVDVDLNPTKKVIEQRLEERGIDGLQFYDGETDLRLRSLPLYLRKELQAL